MGEHLVEGHPVPGGRRLRDILPDQVAGAELASLLQKQNARGGELLGQRPQAEPGVGRVGDVPLQIGRSVALIDEDLIALCHQDGTHELIGQYL